MGAKRVVGVDWPGWKPDWNFIEQQNFVKRYFEQKHDRQFPITYIEGKMEDYLGNCYEMFHHVFAIASIYYAGDPKEIVKKLCNVSKNVILRVREKDRADMYADLFRKNHFCVRGMIREDWQKKLNRNADDFYLYSFEQAEVVRYFRVVNHHERLFGDSAPVNLFQLMFLIGSESENWKKSVQEYKERIPKECITYIKLRDLFNCDKPTEITDESRLSYNWSELVDSVQSIGIKMPIIVLRRINNDKISYVALEGRHRMVACSLVEPFDPDYQIPTIVVDEDKECAQSMIGNKHKNSFVGDYFDRYALNKENY